MNKWEEEEKKYRRRMDELEEQTCQNRLNTELGCKTFCDYYGTDKCRHKEMVFPKVNRY